MGIRAAAVITRAGCLLLAVSLSGCAAIAAIPTLAIVGDAVSNAFGIYQRREARFAQEDQTAEIKRLRDEIAAHREAVLRAVSPAYLCVPGQADGAAALLCQPYPPSRESPEER